MKQALLVIDMLDDFVLPGAPLEVPAAREILPRIEARIAQARAEGRPVIYVCDSHDPDDEEFELYPPHAVAGTEGAGVVAQVAPRSGDMVVAKKRFSGFYGTNLGEALKDQGIDSLELTGVCTDICIQYTAADAVMRGFKVTIPSDSVAALSETAHDQALDHMRQVLHVEVI